MFLARPLVVEFQGERATLVHAQNFQEVRLRDINPQGGAIAGDNSPSHHENSEGRL